MWSTTVVLLMFPQFLTAAFYKTNLTDFSKCQVYYSRSGIIYKDFFEFGAPAVAQNGSLLDFHFSVLGSSDAHILLAPSSTVEKGDPVYEIVIGAGGNTFCDIRRNQKSGVKATIRIKGLLSGLDIHSFWVHITRDGVIDVGKEGEELGFLTWTDPDPLPLKVFSFSTWPGVEAKWFFDCPRENSTHSKAIKRPLSPLETLRRDLLFYYDPYVRPVLNVRKVLLVELKLNTSRISLDESKSQLDYGASVTLSWKDEKIRWNPQNYSNISVLHIYNREIWVPSLFLYNPVDNADVLQDTLLTMDHYGNVTWTTTMATKTWCDPIGLGNWPRDIHNCEIILGFYKDMIGVQLLFKSNESSYSCPYSSSWTISQVDTEANRGWRSLKGFDPAGLTIRFQMKRISNSYMVLLFTPFVMVAVSLLLTFWASPFGSLKIVLPCIQLVVSTLILIVLSMIIPMHSKYVPNILLLYSYSLIAVLICIAIEVIVINFSRIQHPALPHWINTILLSFAFKMFLCLPDIEITTEYGGINERKQNPQAMWILLGVVIDKIAFFVYLGLAVYGFSFSF